MDDHARAKTWQYIVFYATASEPQLKVCSSSVWPVQGEVTDDDDDDEKGGPTTAEHILRDFNHELRCKLMEKDRGLKVFWHWTRGTYPKQTLYFFFILNCLCLQWTSIELPIETS